MKKGELNINVCTFQHVDESYLRKVFLVNRVAGIAFLDVIKVFIVCFE